MSDKPRRKYEAAMAHLKKVVPGSITRMELGRIAEYVMELESRVAWARTDLQNTIVYDIPQHTGGALQEAERIVRDAANRITKYRERIANASSQESDGGVRQVRETCTSDTGGDDRAGEGPIRVRLHPEDRPVRRHQMVRGEIKIEIGSVNNGQVTMRVVPDGRTMIVHRHDTLTIPLQIEWWEK